MTNPIDHDDLHHQNDEADSVLQAIDQKLALHCAEYYMLGLRATLIWGNGDTLPTPDTLDQVWQLATPDEDGVRYIVIAASIKGRPLRRKVMDIFRVEAGSAHYLIYGIEELRQNGQEALADTLQTAWELGQLRYINVEAIFSPDETQIDTIQTYRFHIHDRITDDPGLVAIRERDYLAIENLRREFDDATLRFYVAQYWQFATWEEKYLLIHLVWDNFNPLLLPIMEDALDMPYIGYDNARFAHAIALIHLENDPSRIGDYLDDEELAATAIQAWKRKKRQDRQAE